MATAKKKEKLIMTEFFLLTFRCVKLSHIGSGLTRFAKGFLFGFFKTKVMMAQCHWSNLFLEYCG